MSETGRRFRAFISYSQKDKVFARKLHRWLETYRVPLGLLGEVKPLAPKRRLGRFFRDDEEMAATADIAGMVRGAIEESESLIVICSPNSAQSKWVNAEIEHFRATGRGGAVFGVITAGTPNAGPGETECFPPALRVTGDPDNPAAMPIEPLAIDFRKESRVRSLARLAAGLLGINFDDLWRRDRRRAMAQRVRRSLYGLAFVSLIASLVVVGVRSVSIERSRQLAQVSLAQSDAGQYDRALRLAILAARERGLLGPVADEAEPALARAASASRSLVEFSGHTGPVHTAVFSPDGALVASSGEDETTRVWEAATGREISVFRGHRDDPETVLRGGINEGIATHIAFSPDSGTIVTSGLESGEFDGAFMAIGRVWDSQTGVEKFTVPVCEDIAVTEAFILTWDGWGCTGVFDLADGTRRNDVAIGDIARPDYPYGDTAFESNGSGFGIALDEAEDTPIQLSGHDDLVTVVSRTQPGTTSQVVTGSWDKTARIWSTLEGVELARMVGHEKVVSDVSFSPDRQTILTASYDGTVRTWRTLEYEVETQSESALAPLRTQTPERIITGLDPENQDTAGPVFLAEAGTGTEIAVLNGPDGHAGRVNAAVFSADGKRLVTGGDDATFRIWDARSGKPLARYFDIETRVLDVAFSPDATRVATIAWDGASQILRGPRIWDADTGLLVLDLTPPDPQPLDFPTLLGWWDDGSSPAYEGGMGHAYASAAWQDRAMGPVDRQRSGRRALIEIVCDPQTGALGGSLRLIRSSDVARAPSLEGREGEDVCVDRQTWQQRLTGYR